MIDICEPFEDFEYNVVGHYRCWFIALEHVFMIHLTILFFRMPMLMTLTRLYVRNLLITAWPLLPVRFLKSVFSVLFPFDASQSHILCILIQLETALQYAFSLANLQMLTLITVLVAKYRSISFEVSPKSRTLLISLNIFSILNATLFVNIRSPSRFFSVIYAISYCGCFLVYLVTHYFVLLLCTCKGLRRKKEDADDYSYLWIYFLQMLTTIAHFYQFSGVSTFLIPSIFSNFVGDYQIIFRTVTGVHAVRFMVSIIFAAGPTLLLPPVRRQMFKPIIKLKQDRVAASADVRSPDEVHVTFT